MVTLDFELIFIPDVKSNGLPHLSTIDDPDSFFAVIFTALLPVLQVFQ